MSRTTAPTARELEVLAAVTKPNATQATAARALGISQSTVKGTLATLYAKLNVRTAGQAIRVVHERETV